nr:MAG TPA: hypothetical protein [Caudoviricetes sp.]
MLILRINSRCVNLLKMPFYAITSIFLCILRRHNL